jgi:hypothetical protein
MESAGLSAGALALLHVLLWKRISKIEAYAVGTACIGAGLTLYGGRTGQSGAVAAYWMICGAAGGTVCLCYLVRRLLAHERAAGDVAGRLVGEH